MTKTEMVREALDELGPDTTYAKVRDHVQKKYKEEVAESMFYVEKKARRSAVETVPVPVPVAMPSPDATTSVPVAQLPDILVAARQLVSLLGGKENAKRVIDVV